MRSSSDLFFDSRLSRSVVSAAAPVSMVSSAPDIHAAVVSSSGGARDLPDETTSLLDHTPLKQSIETNTIKDRQIIQDAADAIKYFEKLDSRWGRSKHLTDSCAPLWSVESVVFRLPVLTCGLIISTASLIFLTWYSIKLYEKAHLNDHPYRSLKNKNNMSITCDVAWPISSLDICQNAPKSIFTTQNTSAGLVSAAFMRECEETLLGLCRIYNLELALPMGFMVFMPLIGGMLLLMAVIQKLNHLCNLVLTKPQDIKYDFIPHNERYKIQQVLSSLNTTNNDRDININETLISLKTHYLNLIVLANIDEVTRLQSVPLSNQSQLLKQLTYFAALKQDSKLLKPYCQRPDKIINQDSPHGKNSKVRPELFATQRQELDAVIDSIALPASPNFVEIDNNIACGDDLNDMIFSYALGRKYSSI